MSKSGPEIGVSAVVPELCCMLEPPGEFLNFPVARPQYRPSMSESGGVSPQQVQCGTQVQPWAHVELYAISVTGTLRSPAHHQSSQQDQEDHNPDGL
jgi:hypothetical protein